MRKFSLLMISGVFILVMTGCGGGGTRDSIKSELFGRVADKATNLTLNKDDGSVAAAKKPKSYGKGAAGDAHFVQAEDYFVSDKTLGSNTWIRCDLAKMVTAPGPQTKNEGKFMRISDGKEIWTRHYWSTRIAAKADIRLGAIVIAFDMQGNESVYRAPENLEEAQTNAWFMAKITDTSQLHKGYVMVSGGYKVDVENLRVAVVKR